MPPYDLELRELRPGVLRFWYSHWPHDCDDFDLVAMTHAHGRQGSLDSENPEDWYQWVRCRIRVIDGRVERWVSPDEWAETRVSLQDWVQRVGAAHKMAPKLAAYADPNEAANALRLHEQTGPGWTAVQADFSDAIVSYIRTTGIVVTNPDGGS